MNADQRLKVVREALRDWWATDVADPEALRTSGDRIATQLTAVVADWLPGTD